MKKICAVVCGFFVSLAVLLSVGAITNAAVLRFSTHLPRTDPLVLAMVKTLDEIEKKTQGQVKFEKFFDGTMIGVKDSWEELLRGTADIVNISAHNSPGEKVMPLHLMLGDAWIGISDMKKQLAIQKQLMKEFPELAAEWSQVKSFGFLGNIPFNLHTKKRIQVLSDFKGLQLRGLGAWPKYTVEKLGASLVAIPVGEVYIALQKGIIDGLFHDDSSLLTYKFAEVVPYSLRLGGILPGMNNRMCINMASWNKLPDNVKKLFEEMENSLDEEYIRIRNERMEEALKFAREKGVQFPSLTAEETGKLHDLLREEAFMKAKKLDEKGLVATKILNRQQELIRITK